MRFSFALLATLAALCALPACSFDDALSGASSGEPDPTPPPNDAVLAFVDEGTITLAPGEKRAIEVAATPPAAYRVGFTLLGDPLDASLDHAEVMAGVDGRASVTLRAPKQATTFRLRASILDDKGAPMSSVERSVAVSDEGFGAVRVTPQYAGQRTITGWTASVVARTTCADLAADLPGEPEGSLVAETDDPAAAPLIEDAPVGPNLAVTIRAGHFAWGCVDTTALEPDETLDVKVKVLDKPLDISATALELELAFTPDPAAFDALLGGVIKLLGETFLPSGAPEATALLDQMFTLTPPSDKGAFTTRRVDEAWDQVADAHLVARGAPLRQQVAGWVTDGVPLQAPTLHAMLTPDPAAPGVATFTVTQIGSLDAAAAGIPLDTPLSWTAEADDTVLLGGSVLWEPSRYAGGLALDGAQAALGVVEMKDALAQVADCGGLATELGGFGACDTSCVASLCREALGARWTAALKASAQAGLLGTISVNAVGHASVGDEAELLGLQGVWKGTMGDGALSAAVSGPMTGAPSAPPP